MPSSKRIAGLVGPTIIAMLVSEYPLVQPHLYGAQIPPVVYLFGVLMFVAAADRRAAERETVAAGGTLQRPDPTERKLMVRNAAAGSLASERVMSALTNWAPA